MPTLRNGDAPSEPLDQAATAALRAPAFPAEFGTLLAWDLLRSLPPSAGSLVATSPEAWLRERWLTMGAGHRARAGALARSLEDAALLTRLLGGLEPLTDDVFDLVAVRRLVVGDRASSRAFATPFAVHGAVDERLRGPLALTVLSIRAALDGVSGAASARRVPRPDGAPGTALEVVVLWPAGRVPDGPADVDAALVPFGAPGATLESAGRALALPIARAAARAAHGDLTLSLDGPKALSLWIPVVPCADGSLPLPR